MNTQNTDPRVAETIARIHLDRAAYALACAITDEQVWTPDGMITPDRDALTEQFRTARTTWLTAHDTVQTIEKQLTGETNGVDERPMPTNHTDRSL